MLAIEYRDVSKKYKNKIVALDKFNLKIESGKITALLGPNGAGKSTCLNILAGIIRSDSGSIEVFHENIIINNIYKKNIGFVLSRAFYFERLTSGEYLDFVCAMYNLNKNESKKRIDEILSFMDLWEKKNDKIITYSTGMKKKLSLSAALINNPKLLVLDEPFEGIDPISAKTIKDSLKIMVERGTTVLITSHVLDTVEKIADNIAIIKKGRTLLQSNIVDINQMIKNEVTKETYQSLEELFIDLTVDKDKEQKTELSWLK